MRYLKTFGPLAVAAVALMGFAASASATTITGTTGGSPATTTIHWVNENGHVTLVNPVVKIECDMTVVGTVESHGPGVAVSGNLSQLEFSGCTNSWHVTADKLGSASVVYTSGHNGVLSSTGAHITT